jgi:hypothetical protein
MSCTLDESYIHLVFRERHTSIRICGPGRCGVHPVHVLHLEGRVHSGYILDHGLLRQPLPVDADCFYALENKQD